MNDSNRERKRPAFQFYPGDWRRDTALQTCSLAARGLWMEMICLMHEGEPYGHMRVGTKTISVEALARIVGETLPRVRRLVTELEEAGVCSRRDDGTWFSRRMVRDEHLRDARAEGGKVSLGHPTVAARVKDLAKDAAKGGGKDTRPAPSRPSSTPSIPPSLPVPLHPSLSPPLTPSPASASASAIALASAAPEVRTPPAPVPIPGKGPVFIGQRLVVFAWQVEDLTRMLGDHTSRFDLTTWFATLDQRACASHLVIPQRDHGVWLYAQTLQEAQRRGLPIAVAALTTRAGTQTTRLAGALARIRQGDSP